MKADREQETGEILLDLSQLSEMEVTAKLRARIGQLTGDFPVVVRCTESVAEMLRMTLNAPIKYDVVKRGEVVAKPALQPRGGEEEN